MLKKVIRFAKIYGLRRTYVKVAGRLRKPWMKSGFSLPRKKTVSTIGCGQFAFSTISYFIKQQKGNLFLACYDIDNSNARSLKTFYRYSTIAESVDQLLSMQDLETVYIASNHFSHTSYAIQAMEKGIKSIYIEKPISVTQQQFQALLTEKNKTGATLYAGYNRPYSRAIQRLKKVVDAQQTNQGAFTLTYFISGHVIPTDHWYRDEQEGTRICGNMGHWLDLSIHIFAWREMPTTFSIDISYSNDNEPDDNISVNITSNLGDLVTIILTARSEPFEGINESINFQYGDVIAKIDDFRSIDIWVKEKRSKKRFFPKDVGHQRAVLQPFVKENRNWEEIEISTLLMLHITEMVKNLTKSTTINIKEAHQRLLQNSGAIKTYN